MVKRKVQCGSVCANINMGCPLHDIGCNGVKRRPSIEPCGTPFVIFQQTCKKHSLFFQI